MTEIQEEILYIFREFKRICDNNHLRYFAIGGTCIGAIRHRGFIPWDDDLDVAMPLEDYIQFKKIVSKELREPFELYDSNYHKHSLVRFLKLHNGDTTFIEEYQKGNEDRYTGIFMDIMPITGISDDNKQQKKIIRRCNWYSKLNAACRFEIARKSTIKSKLFSIATKPLTLGKPFNYYSTKYETYIGKYAFGETETVLFPWRIPVRTPYKNVFPYEIFREYIEVPFEDTTMRVPKEYDKYLTMDFGSYMQLPPENKRHGGHTAAIIDFHKSYRDYKEKSE